MRECCGLMRDSIQLGPIHFYSNSELHQMTDTWSSSWREITAPDCALPVREAGVLTHCKDRGRAETEATRALSRTPSSNAADSTAPHALISTCLRHFICYPFPISSESSP